MARRLGKRTLTLVVSSLTLLAIVILFLPSVLDEKTDFSLRSIQELLLGSTPNVSVEIEVGEQRFSRSRRHSPQRKSSRLSQAESESKLAQSNSEIEISETGGHSHKSGRRSLTQFGEFRPGSQSGAQGDSSQRGRELRRQAKGTKKGTIGSALTGENRAPSPGATEDSDPEKDPDDEEEEDKPEIGPTVTTPIAGKLMNYKSRKGVSGASLQVLVFHPLSTVPGAPQWVTATAANTQSDGSFSLNVEIPETPAAGAVLGLIFNHKDHTPVAGIPISSVVGGKATNLGVFWLGGADLTLQGTMTPSSIAPEAVLVDTGGLNPLAWDLRVRNTILALFPVYKPGQSDFSLSIGAQETDYENQRWMSLLSNGQWLGSQSVTFAQVEVERNGQTKKERLGQVHFVLGPDTSVRGNVASKNGGALPGSVVTALTSGTDAVQVQITGANGDFRFEKPPATLRGFRVEHSDYLSQEYPYDPRATSSQLELTTRRPNIPITLTDSVTGEAIPSVVATLVGPASPGKAPASQELTLSSTTGQYTLTASFAIANVVFRSEGYFESNVATPNNNPNQAMAVSLTPARVVTQTARQAKARSGANNQPSHGIYWYDYETQSLLAYSQSNWLEFELDFGPELAAFDFELGVRNFRIIDHKYHFQVRIDFPDMEPGNLTILAHQTETQTARLRLPPRTGVQRVRMTWLNDRYIPGQLDANIVVDWIKFHQRPLTDEEKNTGR